MRRLFPPGLQLVPAAVATILMISPWLLCGEPAQSGDAFQHRVFRVFDGDSFLVRVRGSTQRIRIRGVDAPELDQPHGPQSKAILEKMVSGKRVHIVPSGASDGQYQVSDVAWQDYDIASELVRVGAAWVTPDARAADPALADMERQARNAGRGLWSSDRPVPPWEWRARGAP